MGLAVYNSITLDIRFPRPCYKKLLTPVIGTSNGPQARVGMAQLNLNDLQQVFPVILSNYLNYLFPYVIYSYFIVIIQYKYLNFIPSLFYHLVICISQSKSYYTYYKIEYDR